MIGSFMTHRGLQCSYTMLMAMFQPVLLVGACQGASAAGRPQATPYTSTIQQPHSPFTFSHAITQDLWVAGKARLQALPAGTDMQTVYDTYLSPSHLPRACPLGISGNQHSIRAGAPLHHLQTTNSFNCHPVDNPPAWSTPDWSTPA